jgi:hypothetical protein
MCVSYVCLVCLYLYMYYCGRHICRYKYVCVMCSGVAKNICVRWTIYFIYSVSPEVMVLLFCIKLMVPEINQCDFSIFRLTIPCILRLNITMYLSLKYLVS